MNVEAVSDKYTEIIDVIDRVNKEDVIKHVESAFKLGYHVKIEPVVYEIKANPLAHMYHDSSKLRYQVTLLKGDD